jgi:peptidoglycan hydrolase CwlO-like protein
MAQQDKTQANGKDQKILQHDIEEIDKKVEEVQSIELSNKDQIVASTLSLHFSYI